MRSEETLSAKGKKERKTYRKKVMEADEGWPPLPAPGTRHAPRDVPPPSPPHSSRRPLQSASAQVPPECANTESFCPRQGAKHKTARSPVRVHSRRVTWGCQGRGRGHLSGSCTGGHNVDTDTHQREASDPSSSARRGGGAPSPTTPAHRGPNRPSLGSPGAPPRQFLAHLNPRLPCRPPPLGSGASYGRWRWLVQPETTLSVARHHFSPWRAHTSATQAQPRPPPAPRAKLGPLTGTFSQCLPAWAWTPSSRCQALSSTGQPCHPRPGPPAALLPAGRVRRIT